MIRFGVLMKMTLRERDLSSKKSVMLKMRWTMESLQSSWMTENK